MNRIGRWYHRILTIVFYVFYTRRPTLSTFKKLTQRGETGVYIVKVAKTRSTEQHLEAPTL